MRAILASLVAAFLLVPATTAAASDNERLICLVKTHDVQRCFDYHPPPPP